jgi:hypothetical protein
MANTIKIKRSAVQGKVPQTTDIALGELAINTYDGKLFLKKDDGTESIVDISASGGLAEAPIDGGRYARKDGAWVLIDPYLVTPSVTSPADGATGILETPTITTSPFQVANAGSDTHIASQYLITDDLGTTVYDSGEVSDLTSHQIPAGYLQPSGS